MSQQILNKYERIIKYRRENLIQAMISLKNDLDTKISNQWLGEDPNRLGEIQGAASKIDAACGELSAFIQMREDLKAEMED